MMKLKLFIISLFAVVNLSLVARAQTEHWQDTQVRLKQLNSSLRLQYQELDGYLDVLFLSLLSEQHALALGGPGGSKTKVTEEILKSIDDHVFSLQFSPATKQEQILGAIKGKKYLEEGKVEYVSQQSLLRHAYAIIDEIDKANPEVLSTALSILHERKAMVGAEELLGKLKSAFMTSNMTLGEFIQKFKNTQDEPTAHALLDRILFKVLVINRMSGPKKLFAIEHCQELDLPKINPKGLEKLKKRITQIKVPVEVQKLAFHLWMSVGQQLQQKQAEEFSSCQNYPYRMTNQFSTRGIMPLIDIMKMNYYLQQFQKTDLEQLNNLDPANMEMTPADLKYAEALMIMQGPQQKLLPKLKKQFSYEPRTQKMIDDLIFERKIFKQNYQNILRLYQDELNTYGLDHLLPIEGISSSLSMAEAKELFKKILKIEDLIRTRNILLPKSSIPQIAREKVSNDLHLLKEEMKILLQDKMVALETQTETEIAEEKLIKKREEEKRKMQSKEIKGVAIYETIEYDKMNFFTYSDHEKSILTKAEVTPDGKYLALAFSNNTLTFVDIASKQVVMNLGDDEDPITEFSFHGQNEPSLVAITTGNNLQIWNYHTGEKTKTLKGHILDMNSAVYSPKGDFILSNATDTGYSILGSESLLWKADSGEILGKFKNKVGSRLKHEFVLDNTHFMIPGDVREDHLYQIPITTKAMATYTRNQVLLKIAFNPNKDLMVRVLRKVGSLSYSNLELVNLKNGKISKFDEYIFSPRSRASSRSKDKDHALDVEITSLNFSSDGKLLLVNTADGMLYVLEVKTLSLKKKIDLNVDPYLDPFNHRGEHRRDLEYQASFYPYNNKYVLINSKEHRVARILNIETGKLVANLSTGFPAQTFFTADGKYVVMANQQNNCKIWKIEFAK